VPSKAEKRQARRELKLQHNLEKSARQFIDPQPSRTVSQAIEVEPEKKVSETTLTPHQKLMVLDRTHEDVVDSWSWGTKRSCLHDEWEAIVGPYLDIYQTKRWSEIDAEMTGKGRKRRKKHIYYPFEKLVDEAHQRLIELKLDDFAPDIFRFRLSGKRRLFGFRIEATAIFYTVWFDPDHAIYSG
jgi:hypothetical protein